jgi:bifunctional aspartokinase / homoserine dehydrogenase 1
MRVIKFGGSSIGTVARFKNVIRIISERLEKDSIVVVISAIEGVTNKIIAATRLAGRGDKDYQVILGEINKIHYDFLTPLVRDKEYFHTKLIVDSILGQLDQIFKGVFLLKECSPRISDLVVSIGEYLSKCILVGALNSNGLTAEGLDAVDLIKTNSNFGEADVDFDLTDTLIRKAFAGRKPGIIPVINGFAGSNALGEITTFGRSGSDYTATIIAGALKADAVEIWTDVDGILSADPKIVPEASTLSELSYEEAADLAYLGAKVIFPKAMAPAEKAGIPILVLNTFQPGHPGTFIGKTYDEADAGVKAITYLQDLSLVCLNDVSPACSLVIFSRLFALLARLELPVILLNQSASNQSICFVTLAGRISLLLNEIQKEFKLELETGRAGRVTLRNDVTVVSAVGKKFQSHSGLLRKIFETLDDRQIKSLMFLNSSTHKNVSFVIEKSEMKKTVSALHEAFFENTVELNMEKVKNGK